MMERRIALLLSLLALLQSAVCWSHVTEARLRQALRNDYTLAAFVDPSQDLSKALEAEWTSIQETERDNNVVSVDCAARPKLCDEFGVVSFPTVRLFRADGSASRYRGARKASSIVPFLRRSLRPTLSPLDDRNITSFLAVDDVVFVAHLAPGDANLADRFARLADKYRDRHSFALGPPQRQSAVVCYNNQDDEQHSTSQLETVESLEAFVALCARPLIVDLTRRNELEYMNMGKSLVHYFVDNDPQRQAYLKEMRPLAKKYQEYLAFTVIDAREYPDMLLSLGLTKGSAGVLSVQNPSNGDVFPYRGPHAIVLPVVENFLAEIIQGKVQPWSGPEGRGHDEL